MFLLYGGDKELVINGYVDSSFDTDPDNSKSQRDMYFYLTVELLVGVVPRRASWRDLRVKRST